MRKASGFVLGLACLAMVALTAPAAAGIAILHAQDTTSADAAKGSTAARTGSVPPAPARTARPAAPASRPLSQRVFDTPWVLFPTRLTIVIVLLAVSVLFLMSGCWGTVRFAHLLRHMEWKEPPRRLKRGELGAAGTTLGWEFEDRTTRDLAKDAERDQQITSLQRRVDLLSEQQREIVSIFVSVLKGETGSNP